MVLWRKVKFFCANKVLLMLVCGFWISREFFFSVDYFFPDKHRISTRPRRGQDSVLKKVTWLSLKIIQLYGPTDGFMKMVPSVYTLIMNTLSIPEHKGNGGNRFQETNITFRYIFLLLWRREEGGGASPFTQI